MKKAIVWGIFSLLSGITVCIFLPYTGIGPVVSISIMGMGIMSCLDK